MSSHPLPVHLLETATLCLGKSVPADDAVKIKYKILTVILSITTITYLEDICCHPQDETQRDIIARNISGRQIRKLNRIASQSRIPSSRNPRFFLSRTILTKRRRGRSIHVLNSQTGNSNNFDYHRCSDSRNLDRHFIA